MLPAEVVFLHLRRSAAAEANIQARAEELADLFPSIVSVRAIVEVPNRHHQVGKRFRVRLEIGLRRREDLVVERGPAGRATIAADTVALHKADEVDAAFTDLHTVVLQAFEVARKRLQTIASRRRTTARTRAVRAKAKARRTPRVRDSE